MKKVVSVILAIIMVLSMCSIIAFAVPEEKVPIVVLQGYSGPNLAYADEDGNPIVDENGEVKLAWPLNFDALGDDILAILGNVMLSDAEITVEIAKKIKEYLAPIGMNPDGTSKNNLVPYPSGAAATRASTLIENGMEEYIPEKVVSGMAMEEVGAENVFGFTFDWRRSQMDYAEALDKYIQEVKEITGSDKVDIYGLSHGGQYGTTYLYLYGHKGDVRRAMFGNPATLGNTLCGSLFTGEYLNVPLNEIVEFIEHGFEHEMNWEWIFELYSAETIINGANAVVTDPDLWKGIISIPSLWDFVPHEYFQEALNYTGLNLADNQKLYTDTVAYHTLVANGTDSLANRLADLKSDGLRLGYVVGTGYTSPNGKYLSDILIDTHLSSGADCALIGEKFATGYTQAGTVCDNPNHYHISPEFDIDASTGFMPDSTWYIRNQGHGMIMHDEYTQNLVHDFLWGDIENVYSSKEYPQFNMSQNNSEIIYARFDNTSSGYHSSSDSALVVKNMSVESDIVIWSISVNGADIDFDYSTGYRLAKGAVCEFEVTDNDFENAGTPFELKITYSLLNVQMTYETMSFGFTPMSDAQMSKYSYLSNVAEVVPDESGTEEPGGSTETPGETPDNSAGDSNGNNANGGNVDSDNPQTDANSSVIAIATIVVVSAFLAGMAIITGVVVVKRKENY